MKAGDQFKHKGDWQTEPGTWEVVTPDVGCGQTLTKCVDGHHKGETSEWHTSAVVAFIADTKAGATAEAQPSQMPQAAKNQSPRL